MWAPTADRETWPGCHGVWDCLTLEAPFGNLCYQRAFSSRASLVVTLQARTFQNLMGKSGDGSIFILPFINHFLVI